MTAPPGNIVGDQGNNGHPTPGMDSDLVKDF